MPTNASTFECANKKHVLDLQPSSNRPFVLGNKSKELGGVGGKSNPTGSGLTKNEVRH